MILFQLVNLILKLKEVLTEIEEKEFLINDESYMIGKTDANN